MQTFTKAEMIWVSEALDKLAVEYRQKENDTETTNIEAGLYKLRADQLSGISSRLRSAVENNNKRIEIKY